MSNDFIIWSMIWSNCSVSRIKHIFSGCRVIDNNDRGITIEDGNLGRKRSTPGKCLYSHIDHYMYQI